VTRPDVEVPEGADSAVIGDVGIVLGIEVSRLARNNADWYQLRFCVLSESRWAAPPLDGCGHVVADRRFRRPRDVPVRPDQDHRR